MSINDIDNNEPDPKRRVGRPAVGPAILVRFPAELLSRVDAVVDGRSRAEFIREAVEMEVRRREAVGAANESEA